MTLLNSLINASNDAVFIAHVTSGNLLYTNEAGCRLTGYALEEIIGMHQTKLHPPEDLDFSATKFKEFVSSNDYKELDTHILHRNGTRVPVKITSSNMFEDDGSMYVAAYFKDMSSSKKLEKIAFIQSHTVRAPIANILGLIDLMEMGMIVGEQEQRETLENIKHLTLNLDRIVREIVNKTIDR